MYTCIPLHGLKRSWHSCPRRVNAGKKNTPSMHHPRRRNVITPGLNQPTNQPNKQKTQTKHKTKQKKPQTNKQQKNLNKPNNNNERLHTQKSHPKWWTLDIWLWKQNKRKQKTNKNKNNNNKRLHTQKSHPKWWTLEIWLWTQKKKKNSCSKPDFSLEFNVVSVPNL